MPVAYDVSGPSSVGRKKIGKTSKSLHFKSCKRGRLCVEGRSPTEWPVRLSVRTPGFQPGKRGSIPLRAATSSLTSSPFIAPVASSICAYRGVSACGQAVSKNSCKFSKTRENSSCAPREVCVEGPSPTEWPVRLSVRTPGFQPGKRGSIPLRDATFTSPALQE